MKAPIAIIAWTPGPRVAFIHAVDDLEPSNFSGLRTADIFPGAATDCAALAVACEELQRATGAAQIRLHPVADAWSAQTWPPA